MKKRWIAAGLAALLLASLAGCSEELPAVYVQPVSQIMGYGAMGEFNTCAGVVVAQNEVKIARDESRKIAELKVEVGQIVTEGQELFSYDTNAIQLDLDKAKLEIEQMKNSITDLKAQIKKLEADKKKAPESEKLSYTVQIQSLETQQKETEYNIDVKEREMKSLEDTAQNASVKAPITGEVKAINENGGYDDYTGQPLPYITLLQSGNFRVKSKINELNRAELQLGQSVIVRSRVDSTVSWTGTISEIGDAPDENQNQGSFGYYDGMKEETTSSSTYPFYVDLDSTDGLLLGQHVYVEPDKGQEEQTAGISLFADYVLGDETEGYYVWAAGKGEKIEKRSVTVASYDEMQNLYQITDGLSLEDRIAYPSDEVQAGAPVTDTMPEPSEDDSNVGGLIDEDFGGIEEFGSGDFTNAENGDTAFVDDLPAEPMGEESAGMEPAIIGGDADAG